MIGKMQIEKGLISLDYDMFIGMSYTDLLNHLNHEYMEENFTNIKGINCKCIIFKNKIYDIQSEFHVYLRQNQINHKFYIYKFVIIQNNKSKENTKEIVQELKDKINKQYQDHPFDEENKIRINQYCLEIQISRSYIKSCLVLDKQKENIRYV